ncbi:MAG: MarR family transcriptional regulator [Dissulfurimicrobium sp.]|uniref:MarR family transcriptional regulator n=2 Tax=Dissulfurimicrobium sp. TaxID=2022436 RepID=UPI00404B3F22
MIGKRSRPYTVDDVEFVYNNYAKMTASEIADKLGISKFQVSKIVGELRKHIELPKKTIQKPNPILLFLEKLGVQPKVSAVKESSTSRTKR